jgi:DNA-binding transcriptional ArsR family regulator
LCVVCRSIAARPSPAPRSLRRRRSSYHLKQLVDAGVLVRERRGRYSYYQLVDGVLDHIATLVALPEQAAA